MSTKFNRPSGAYDGATGLENRDKYQGDAAAVPKVAISSAKIDGDFNYIIDALNGMDDASGSRSSIEDRLNVSLNADGTLKGSVVATVDDWVVQAGVFTRVDDVSFSVDSDVSSLFVLGRRLQLVVDGTTVYADVLSSTYNGSITTVICAQNVISVAPSVVRYAPIVAGSTGAGQSVFEDISIRGNVPVMRIAKDSGGDFAVRENSGALVISENTGTPETPVWADKVTVDSSGLVLADEALPVSKLQSSGMAGDVLTAQDGAAPMFAAAVPAGSVFPFAGETIPTGYLLCDGRAISRGTYARLFTALGETYGAGDSITTFNLPDLRGRAVFGVDDGAGVLASGLFAEVGGSESATTEEHILTVDEIPAHSHTFASRDANSNGSLVEMAGASGASSTVTTSESGGGLGHSHDFSILPPYMCLNYIIKT